MTNVELFDSPQETESISYPPTTITRRCAMLIQLDGKEVLAVGQDYEIIHNGKTVKNVEAFLKKIQAIETGE